MPDEISDVELDATQAAPSETDATQAAPSEEDTQLEQSYTAKELADLFRQATAEELTALREELRGQNNALWQGFERRLTPVEQRSRKTERLLERLFDTTASPEDRREVEAALNNELLQERAKAQEEWIRAQATGQSSSQEQVDYQFTHLVGPELEEYAKSQGVDYQEAQREFPKALRPSKEDPTAWRGFMRDARAVIDRKADEQQRRARPRTRVENTPTTTTAPRKPEDYLREYFEREVPLRQ